MPIRFRCQHCQQLLGIARRKAGTRVECPTCRARVLVPFADTIDEQAAAVEPREPLFERSDFDKILQSPGGNEPSVLDHPSQEQPPPAAPPDARSPGPRFEVPAFDVERLEAPPPGAPSAEASPPPVGYLLTPARTTLLAVLSVLLLALAFGAGLYVGRYVL